MNNIKTVFSIKDLENISGVKAHTIRIWEKRFAIFEPDRSETNIRNYNLSDLQKLLNIVLLNEYGYKISKIATYSNEKINSSVREIISEKSVKNHVINAFKMAMINYDQELFLSTYNNLLSYKSFREIFYEIIIPFMNEIGLLWQSNTINAAQEHFIFYLIKQKILVNTEKLQLLTPTKHDKIFVLYLPENEMHELGLMYLNYEVLVRGYKSIYLGESVPIENLLNVKDHFTNIIFIGYLTLMPEPYNIENYIDKIETKIISENSSVWFIGKNTKNINQKNLHKQISVFETIDKLVEQL